MIRPTTATYLYCVLRAPRKPATQRVPPGVPGASPPEVHSLAPGLWIATADVPLALYGPSHLEPRLRDLDWVSEAALAHEAVIEHLARKTPVIPMKLFTLFSSLDRARADLLDRLEEIKQTMKRIAGAEEWGVRVFRRENSRAEPSSQPAASGAAFLRAKKDARDAAAAARAAAAGAADVAFATLRRHAREARVRETRQEPGITPPILDAAFLVPAAARARFRAEAKRQSTLLARAGGELVLTGPWPAYNFVTAEDRA
jgi:hypothetical protein